VRLPEVRGSLSLVERVAVVTPFSPAAHPGGVEVFCRQLEKALGPLTIFSAFDGSRQAVSFRTRFGLEGPYRAFWRARALFKEHRRRPFQLVITNGYCGWPLQFVGDAVPMIQVYHLTAAGLARSGLASSGDRFTTATIGALFEGLAGSGKTVVSVSESVRREVSRYYGHSSHVIPNGVDTRLFRVGSKSHARERLDLPQDTTIGLFVGRSEFAKGFDLLLRAAQAMPEILFLSVSQPKAAPHNIRFVTNVPHEEMPALYSAADFFFVPSRYEGFNISLLEALSCDLPAVLSRAACPFEPNPKEIGIILETPTTDALVEAIRRAVSEGPRRGLRDRIAKVYSLENFARNWRGLVSSVLTQRPIPAKGP